MSLCLFIVYLLLGSYWIYSWSKKHTDGIVWQRLILTGFLLRVLVAVVFGYYNKSLEGNDYWLFFRASQEETDYLLHRFGYFLYEGIFDNNGYAGNPFKSFFFRNGDNFFFNDLRDNLIIKFEAVLNLLSGRNYYINQLLASILFMFPLLALAKVFDYWIRPQYKYLSTLFFLFYPPLLIWVSNIHKDMVCVMCLALLLYVGTFGWRKKGWRKAIAVFSMLFSFLLLALLKNYLAIALLVAALATMVAKCFTTKKKLFFLLTYCSILFLFCLSTFFPNSINLPLLLSRKQNGFYDIGGAQPLHLLPMDGHLYSYFRNIPSVIQNVCLYPFHLPFWNSFTNFLGLFSFLSSLFLVYNVIRYPLKSNERNSLFVWLMVGFCFLTYFVIGVSVPAYGALLRYRAIPEVFLFLVLAQNIDFKRVFLYQILKKYIYLFFNKKSKFS